MSQGTEQSLVFHLKRRSFPTQDVLEERHGLVFMERPEALTDLDFIPGSATRTT